MKPIIALCVLFALFTGNAFSQWTSSGPSGSFINCNIQIGPDIYVGTPAGIYKSTNGGISYKILPAANLPSIKVRYLFFDDSTFYAGFDGVTGVYISNDTGRTWEPSVNGMGTQFYLNPKSFVKIDGRVFCSSSIGTYYSDNHGKGWTQLIFPGNLGQYAMPLYCIGKTLFKQERISSNYTLYRSSDAGATWMRADTGLDQREVVNIIETGNTLYLFNRELVYTSTNGTRWKPMTNQPIKMPNGSNAYFDKVCYNGQRFFGAPSSGGPPSLYTIEPGDSQWATSPITDGYAYALFNYGTTVYFGGYQKFHVTIDNGDNWSQMDNLGLSTLNISSILALGNDIFAVNNSRIYLSADEGLTWNTGINNYLAITCLNSFNNVLYAGTSSSGLWSSKDFGQTWKQSNINAGNIYAITNDGTNLYAGGDLNSGTSAYKSTDSGKTWNFFHSGWPSSFTIDMLVFDGNVFAAMRPLGSRGIYKTPVAASNWLPSDGGLPATGNYSLAAIGNTLYTGTFDQGVYKSVDGGANWTAENKGLEKGSVYTLAASGSDLFAGADVGVYMLKGGSGQWQNISYNLPGKIVNKLAVNGNFLYAATYNASVWQIPLNKLAIDRVKKNPFTFEIYPNPANTEFTVGGLQLAMGDNIKVLDLSGRVVNNKIINEVCGSINIPTVNLVEGIYFLQVMKDGNVFRRKFVVMH